MTGMHVKILPHTKENLKWLRFQIVCKGTKIIYCSFWKTEWFETKVIRISHNGEGLPKNGGRESTLDTNCFPFFPNWEIFLEMLPRLSMIHLSIFYSLTILVGASLFDLLFNIITCIYYKKVLLPLQLTFSFHQKISFL